MSKFWKFIQNSTKDNSEDTVELRIQGDFIDAENAWIYEYFGIPVASPNAFRKELSKYEGKNLCVWIDSYGGSVFAGMGIYNALMNHKKTGGKIKTIADSKVMSAATLPFMAGDDRVISPGAIYMMHNPLTEAYGYASDLRKTAEILDEVKEAIINIYQLGTGLVREKISSLMDDETYWSANTAIKEGFATEMLCYDGKNEEDENKLNNVVNFSFNRIAIQNAAADSSKKLLEILSENQSLLQEKAQKSVPVQNKTKGEDFKMEPKNAQELEAMYPDFVAQIKNAAKNEGKDEGAKAERTRIQNIEKIAKNIDPNLVNNAKYETFMDAKELAFQAMQNENNKGQEYLNNLETDTQNSGVNNITATPQSTPKDTKPKTVEDMIMSSAAKFDRMRRGEK